MTSMLLVVLAGMVAGAMNALAGGGSFVSLPALMSLRALLVATLFGGLVGALLLLRTPSTAFTFVLPWLLLVASIALAFGRRIGEALRAR